jgi:hypothetical protein
MKNCLNPNAHCRFLIDYPKHVALLSHTTGVSLEARWLTLVEVHAAQKHEEGDSDEQ